MIFGERRMLFNFIPIPAVLQVLGGIWYRSVTCIMESVQIYFKQFRDHAVPLFNLLTPMFSVAVCFIHLYWLSNIMWDVATLHDTKYHGVFGIFC